MKFEWTDEVVRGVLDMWTEGKSGGEIADTLKAQGHEITRSAALGKLHRIGAMKPGATRRKATHPKVNNALKAEKPAKLAPVFTRGFQRPKLKLVVAGNGAVMVVPPPVRSPRAEYREVAATVAIEPRVWTSRKFGECAYPVDGEGADTRSCCNPTKGKTYCPTHARVMLGTMPKSWAGFSQRNFAKKVA